MQRGYPRYPGAMFAAESTPGGVSPLSQSKPAGAPHPAEEVILRAVLRLIEVVDQETIALRDHAATNLSEFNARKAHGLLELDRSVTLLNGAQPGPAIIAVLRELRDKLDANSRMLSMHIEAVREIAGVIADTIREADSDGTYTNAYRSKG